MGEVQRQGCFEIIPLLGESMRESSQAPHAHPHRKILPLDIGGADLVEVGVTLDGHWDGLDNFPWTVALPRFFVVRI